MSYYSVLAIASPAPRVPSVIGYDQTDAAAILQAAGFRLGRVSQVVDITCAYIGEVTTPEPGRWHHRPARHRRERRHRQAGGKCL